MSRYSNISLICIAAQEVLESLKDRWFQADNPPADQLLNEQEFLSFLHPEHSRGMLKYMVKEIVRDLGTFYFPNIWIMSFSVLNLHKLGGFFGSRNTDISSTFQIDLANLSANSSLFTYFGGMFVAMR